MTAPAASTQADAEFKRRVESIYTSAFPQALVDVSGGHRGRVHVIIVSREFDDMTEKEKQDVVWEVARRELGEDAQGISLLLAYTPEELK